MLNSYTETKIEFNQLEILKLKYFCRSPLFAKSWESEDLTVQIAGSRPLEAALCIRLFEQSSTEILGRFLFEFLTIRTSCKACRSRRPLKPFRIRLTMNRFALLAVAIWRYNFILEACKHELGETIALRRTSHYESQIRLLIFELYLWTSRTKGPPFFECHQCSFSGGCESRRSSSKSGTLTKV